MKIYQECKTLHINTSRAYNGTLTIELRSPFHVQESAATVTERERLGIATLLQFAFLGEILSDLSFPWGL